MKVGDQAIFYHSNAKPRAAGICKIVKAAEPDPTQFDPASKYYDPGSTRGPAWDWVTVPVRQLKRFVPLDVLRTMPELASVSCWPAQPPPVIPLTDHEFDAIVRGGNVRRAGRPESECLLTATVQNPRTAANTRIRGRRGRRGG